MIANASAHIGLVRQAVTAAGAKLPKEVAQALADRDTVVSKAANFQPAGHEEVADAIAAALLADRDPLDDAAVRRLLASRALLGEAGSLVYLVQLAAERRIVASIDAHVDAIVASFVTAASTCADQLTTAHRVIGDYDLDDHANILRRGGDEGSKAWNTAVAAVDLLRRIDSGWVALAELTRFARTDTRALRLADMSLEQYEQVGRRADAWTITRAGITLRLADRTTLAERIERINTERARRDNQQAGSFGREFRRLHGTGVAG